jgi:hypothetical protein
MASGSARRPSRVLVVALLVALAAGAAASLLIGSATAPNAPPYRASEVVLPPWLVTAGVVAAVLFFIGGLFYQRLRGGSVPLSGRTFVTFLVLFLVAILFLVTFQLLAGYVVSPAGSTQGTAPPSGNSTGTPGSNNSGVNLSHVDNVTAFTIPGLPTWVPFALLVGVVVIVAVLALPAVRAYAEDRRASRFPRSPARVETAEVLEALREAEAALETGTDPRSVVVRLYGELLDRLGRVVGGVEPETPEEIRTLHLVRLGIRPETATVLTRLFEEARYSSHPLGLEVAERARAAIREALADLDRVPEAA